jgi:hypothetical protein
LRDSVKAVATLHARIRNNYKVAARNIFVAGSSGLFSAIRDKDDLIKENKKTLSEAVEKAIGATMGFVSDQEEAELSVVGVVPRTQAAEAALIDVGSGNTKGGCRGADGKLISFSVPFGTVSFASRVQAAARKTGATFAVQAVAVRDEELAPALRKALASQKEISERTRIYLSGGAVWALTTFIHPGDAAGYVELSAADIDAYEALLRGDANGTASPDLSALKNDDQRKTALAEAARVRKATTPEQMLAGAEILKGLSAELRWKDDGKRLYFARDAYLGWLLPYIAQQAGLVK